MTASSEREMDAAVNAPEREQRAEEIAASEAANAATAIAAISQPSQEQQSALDTATAHASHSVARALVAAADTSPFAHFILLCCGMEGVCNDLIGLLYRSFYGNDGYQVGGISPRTGTFESFLSQTLELFPFRYAGILLKYIYESIWSLSPKEIEDLFAPLISRSSNEIREMRIDWLFEDSSSSTRYLVSFEPRAYSNISILLKVFNSLRCLLVHSASTQTASHTAIDLPTSDAALMRGFHILSAQPLAENATPLRENAEDFGKGLITKELRFFEKSAGNRTRFPVVSDHCCNALSLFFFARKMFRLFTIAIQFLWATQRLKRKFRNNDTFCGIPVFILKKLVPHYVPFYS